MLRSKVTWNLTAVLSVHVLRFILGFIVVRFFYPLFFAVTPFLIEVTDRLVVLGLVWFTMQKYGEDFSSLGLSFSHLGVNLMKGIIVGFLLLVISSYSEKIYATMLFITPTNHPLIMQVENALTWGDLVIPLLLAGVLAPISEELLYRVVTFLPMKKRWGFWGGAIVSSLIFAVMHFNLYWFGEMVIVGLGLAALYYFTGSLLSAMVAHAVLNTSKILMVFWGISLL